MRILPLLLLSGCHFVWGDVCLGNGQATQGCETGAALIGAAAGAALLNHDPWDAIGSVVTRDGGITDAG